MMTKDRILTETASEVPSEPLAVIDRLEVGPVRLQQDRLTAQYTVTTSERTFSTDLVSK